MNFVLTLEIVFEISIQTRRFRIFLFIREKQAASSFSIHIDPNLAKVGINVKKDDILFNYTSTDSQAMNGTMPWRGAREKDEWFMQMFLEAFTSPGSVILDATAATGE